MTETTVSARHCRVTPRDGAFFLEDLGSVNGTFVKGTKITTAVRVSPGDAVTLGRTVKFPWKRLLALIQSSGSDEAAHTIIRVGRYPDNDVVLNYPAISGYHARVLLTDRGAIIEDLASRNGTALGSVDNKIRRGKLSPGDTVFLGSHSVSASQLLTSATPAQKPAVDEDSSHRSRAAEGTLAESPPQPSTDFKQDADSPEWKPQLASVVFTDIVGFTRHDPSEQVRTRRKLESCVQESETLKQSLNEKTVLLRPTGDGCALVFFAGPWVAAKCAVEVAQSLRKDGSMQVRLGINHGPVYRMKDLNGNDDVSGSGINMAQRVMDCGDAGHILLSATVADALKGTIEWCNFVRPIGTRIIKHGLSIDLFNLWGPDFGVESHPAEKRTPKAHPRRSRRRT